jgi:glycosyltransferase involved in cell wall biosynthesis
MTHFVVVTTSFPDSYFQEGQEAAGSFVYDFVVECARQVEVTVVAPSKEGQVETAENLTIIRFPVPSLPLSLLNPVNPANWPRIVKTLRSGEAAVRRAVQQKPTDHIFALWVLPSGYWAMKVGQEMSVPYSSWALGSDIWGLGKVSLIRNVLRDVLRKSQYRFADGLQLADDVVSICSLKCDFLPSSRRLPVTISKKPADNPPYKLAFLGRWHPNKGVDLLLQSLRLLDSADWQKIDEIRLFGGGPLEAEVVSQCDNLKRDGRPITQGGYLDRNEATELLLWADYLLLPSRIESIPVIFSDGLQTGCPLIATPTGDLPHLLRTYKVGELAESITPSAYAEAIRRALHNSPSAFGQELQRANRAFSLEQTAQNLLKILQLSGVR